MDNYHGDYFNQGDTHRPDLTHRLDLIKKNWGDSIGNVLDAGCSGGFYSFGLCDMVDHIDAVDREQGLIEQCTNIKEREKITNIHFVCNDLAEFLLWDKTYSGCLYMSTHHHVIQAYGWEKADYVLRLLSARCSTMFFDMGQKDENASHCKWWSILPPTPDSEHWVREYLKRVTLYDDIKCIGSSSIHDVNRYLFRCDR